MPTIYDVDYLVSYNGYAEDMRPYMAASKPCWTCKELWFPYGANLLYGHLKKTRIQRICEKMDPYSPINYIDERLISYSPLQRVKELIALGGDPDIEDRNGMTALMICSRNGWEKHLSMIKILLNAGADINRKSCIGSSALYLACFNGNLAIAKELIRRGANIHSLDRLNETPLHVAVKNDHLAIVKFLLENGATLNSSVMKSAIHGNKPSMIKYLHTLGTPMPEIPLLSALSNKHYGLVKTLVNCGANRDEPLGPVTTILEGFLDDDSAVLALCQAGANVNVSSNGTPLICAAVSLLRRNLGSLKILCKYKVNLNVQDTDGLTPLHILVDDAKLGDDGDLTFIKVLLKNPIDFSLVDNFGETALDIAVAKGDKAIICEIKKAMLRQKMK